VTAANAARSDGGRRQGGGYTFSVLLWRRCRRPVSARLKVLTLAADTAAMAKKPEPPKLVTWDVYRAAHKPKIVGSVQAADADEAVQKAAQEFKVHAWRLIAVQRS